MLRHISILFAFALAAASPAFATTNAISGADGLLRFPLDSTTPPTIHCTPLYVCDIVLEPGESLINAAIGDNSRWTIDSTTSGPSSADTVHVLVKPYATDLHTDLIITTNRRAYYLSLVSQERDPMSRIGFLYPQDFHVIAQPTPQPTPVIPSAAVDKLDFAYHFSGDSSLQPLRVFNDGTHTYLQMPAGLTDIPVLFAVGRDGTDSLVNYRFTGGTYIVDGVPPSIALVDGSVKHSRRAVVSRGN